jgi:hypothetical protein
LAALQRDGVVSAAKVQIVERAIHTLSRPNLDPQAVQTAEQLLTDQAAILAPAELHRFAQAVVAAADPDGPEPVDDQLQHDRRHLELNQRRDGMWQLHGRLSNTVGAQLNAIWTHSPHHDSTAIEDQAGNIIQIRMNAPCAAAPRCTRRSLRPAIESRRPTHRRRSPGSGDRHHRHAELHAKTGLAETADGTQLTAEQLLRIADEAEIWPTIIDRHGVPLALGRHDD